MLKKLDHPFGIFLLATGSIVIALLVSYFGFAMGALLLAALIGVPCIYASIVYPKFGMVVLFVLSAVIFVFIRIGINFPLGTLIDGFEALLILAFLIKQKIRPNWSIYKNPISTIIIIWILYNLLEFINPEAESRLAWVYTIRSVAMVMLMYFVFLYNLDNKKSIRLMLKVWLVISFIFSQN